MDVAKRLEPEFWTVSANNDSDSAARLKAGGMEMIEVPAPMMADMRAKARPMIDDFIRKAPAADAKVSEPDWKLSDSLACRREDRIRDRWGNAWR